MRVILAAALLAAAPVVGPARAAPPGLAASPSGPLAPALGSQPLAAPTPPTLAALHARFGPQSRFGRDAQGRIHALRRLSAPLAPGLSQADAVSRVFAESRALFGLAPSAPVVPTLREALALPGGGHVLTFDLGVAGIPLDSLSLAARLRPDGRLAELRLDPLPARLVGTPDAPRISAEDARSRAITRAGSAGTVGSPRLVYLATSPLEGRLAWRVPVAEVPLAKHAWLWLDAADGTLLARRAATLH